MQPVTSYTRIAVMNRLSFLLPVFLVSLANCLSGHAQTQAAESNKVTSEAETVMEFGIGGVGGVYFLAEPGELIVDLQKRDRNRRGRPAELRAILVGPDRRVIEEVTIPDDGQSRGSGLGPVQQARLRTQVERKGVYALNVTVSQDRYGDEIVWGFNTNCPRYLIETSRGHKDERHQEPIVLLNPDKAGDVCFAPRKGAFAIEATNLPKGVDELSVYNGQDTLVQTLPASADRTASHVFPADKQRGATPWRLSLPAQQATLDIDGVTRWDNDDLSPNVSCWTPNPRAWFPFQMYRWILTPYSRTLYGQPGDKGDVVFQVHNHSDQTKAIGLQIEFPDREWSAELSTDQVVLKPKATAKVAVRYRITGEDTTRVCHLRATPADHSGFSTYSTLTIKPGAAPATEPLDIPIVLKPYQHENEQFGYLPDCPVDNQPYFDLENRPFVNVGGRIASCRNGQWTTSDLRTAVVSRGTGLGNSTLRTVSTKVAFDSAGGVYLLAMAGRQASLLHSSDGGKTFAAYLIPGQENRSRSFDFEQFTGNNVPDGPPPIVCYTRTGEDPRLRWRKMNDLELLLPKKTDEGITVEGPILISKRCIGLSTHSGIPATVVSRESKVHVAWAEATDPEVKVPGVPTYVVTYDRKSCKLGEPVLVGYGAPPNDIHNSPSITMDSQGYLHVLAGTHGQPFQYARSLEPNDAHSGWTEAVPVGEGLRQTYIGFVCGPDDTLHLAFRLWWYGTEPHPASHHATLAYQRKRPGKPWEEPKVLIVPPFSEYSIFYHRLTIDRAGRLFLSYDYWSTFWFYRNDHRGNRRALLRSEDQGKTWKLAETRDFQRAVGKR